MNNKRKLYLWLKKYDLHDVAKWLHKTKVKNAYQGDSLSVYVSSFYRWKDTPQGFTFWSAIRASIQLYEYCGFNESWKGKSHKTIIKEMENEKSIMA